MPVRLAKHLRHWTGVALWLLACVACSPSLPATITVGAPSPTPTNSPVAVTSPTLTRRAPPLATPTAVASVTPRLQTLRICAPSEPESLYLYHPNAQSAADLQPLWQEPVFSAFGQAQGILARTPTWENGDVRLKTVTVAPGMPIVTPDGEIINLGAGARYRKPDGSIATAAAGESITTLEMLVVFTLRPALRWSDGEPLTAQDSVFSFETLKNLPTPSASQYRALRSASYLARSQTTVEWQGMPGWWDNQFWLNFAVPLPLHRYNNPTAADLLADSETNQHPLSFGPFQVFDWQVGQSLHLKPNPYYWQTQPAHFRDVLVSFVPDTAAALQAVTQAQCDFAFRPALQGWGEQFVEIVSTAKRQKLTYHIQSNGLYEHLDFGIASQPEYNSRAGNAMQDPSVRQAIAHCIDRAGFASSHAPLVLADSFVPPAAPWAIAEPLPYSFDPERGQALLAASGWSTLSPGGIRQRDTDLLRLNYTYPSEANTPNPLRVALATYLRTQLAENCQIDLVIDALPKAEAMAIFPAGVIFGRQFDLAQYTWLLDGLPTCELYTSAEVPRPDYHIGINASGWQNADYDNACQTARFATDSATQAASFASVQQIFITELPSLPLFWQQQVAIARPSLQDWQPATTQTDWLSNIAQWQLAEQ